MKQSRGFTKRKRRDPNSITVLKEKAWRWYSIYIRLRDADWKGFNTCVTCGVTKYYAELQSGHFTPGRRRWILFDERGCHPQCYKCNIALAGNPRKYQAFMMKKYGLEVIAELDRASDLEGIWTTIELKEIEATYKAKAQKLAAKLGIQL